MQSESPLNFRLPDYTGDTLVNLLSSLRYGLGDVTSCYAPTTQCALEAIQAAQNVVVCVIDGLGEKLLHSVTAAACLREQQCGTLSSVFPSTTAAAITTFLTGEAAQQHGLTGWFVRLAEAGGVVAVLPCEGRDRSRPLHVTAEAIAQSYGHVPLFNRLPCESYIISPEWILDSAFNRAHTGKAQPVGYRSTLTEMCTAIVTAVRHTSNKKYLYAYWSELDHLSHLHGQYSEPVVQHLIAINQAMEKLVQTLRGSNTLLLLTADHGFIDTTPERVITVNDHPELQACLAAPLCGEPRLAYCYVKPDKQAQFTAYIQTNFAEQIILVPSPVLLAEHAFGLGEPHPRLHERIGDYTLVLRNNWVIKDWLDSEKRFFNRGVHGGVSHQEMQIPLIAIQC